MHKVFFILLFFIATTTNAQELDARVTINTNRIGNNINKNVFKTLETALTNFLNTRKWTKDEFAQHERIRCNFILNLDASDEQNVYNAQLIVQAARPVYNSTYTSPLINYQDKDVKFKYIEFQVLEFNENRVSGNDPLVANLTAAFAYYAYVILGTDYNSFGLKGGEQYFLKAQNIINNAPEGRGIGGWKAFDGNINRYWLVENMLNTRYNIMYDVYYNYYRLALDKLYEDETAAAMELINVLVLLDAFSQQNPNRMITQFFFQGKANEIIKTLTKATTTDKIRASAILQKLDITNANRYKDELK
jgi:hypothetical protein